MRWGAALEIQQLLICGPQKILVARFAQVNVQFSF
jgi:hypothetical protein